MGQERISKGHGDTRQRSTGIDKAIETEVINSEGCLSLVRKRKLVLQQGSPKQLKLSIFSNAAAVYFSLMQPLCIFL